MASISKPLELKDSFSSVLDRFVSKLKKAVEQEKEYDSATEALMRKQAELNLIMGEWEDRVTGSMQLGYGLVGSLENMTDALRALNADIQSGETRFMRLADAMPFVNETLAQNGLAWTEAADGLSKEQLLLSHTPEQLTKLGYLVKQTTEEVEQSTKALKKHNILLDGLGKKLLSIGALFFTARKLVQYFRQALERSPDDLLKPYEKLKENIRNLFDRSAISGLAAMQDGLQKLNELMASPAGQKFAETMAKIGYIIGTVVGGGISLLVDLIGLVIDAFGQMGLSADQVVTFIATLASGLYVTLYNIVATMYNVIASFAEFLVNVWSDPAGAIQVLFWRLADAVLGFIQSIGDGFDALMSKLGIQTGVGGWLAGVRASAETKLNDSLAYQSANAVQLPRMDLLDYGATAEDWAGKAGSFDPMSLQLKAINRNTGSIAKSAASIDKSLQEADIKALIDVAERKFVSMVNLTSQTPVVTVNGANTGNTQQDRINLANTIRDILLEQLAIGSTTSSAAYGV